ncbi:serine hydrolase domain-containing protein [Winogradskyella flava]|uniref:Beta-lactamase family protein n=1 Tax=Winogradskyella flava TaxID=1884876 RepID=A0A842ISH1_9FLAO|nr:serine hydrolase domain-containing protein [Winogradskyella flava]MBC2845725.1 beta-lactamase family protein [Winogradskyella flava]
MKNIFTKALVLFLIYSSCKSQNRKSNKVIVHSNTSVEIYNDAIGKEIKQIIDKNAKEILKDSLINSLSIGLYINNVSFAFNYGELTKGKGDIPTNKTIYEIASVTKTFTGTLAAKAVLEGKLTLEDDIRNYLSKPYRNLEYKGEPIKIKHLLTHTSGLPGDVITLGTEINQNSDEIGFNKIVVAHENKKTKAVFFESLSKINLTEKPGTIFNYSNAGTNLMGYILEKVYKKPFQKLIMNEIVSEAQMEDTYFNVPKNKQPRLANGYLLGKPMPKTKLANTLWGAEGALKSTTSDILKYISYQFKNNAIVKESHKKIFEAGPDYWICYFWWSIEDQNYDLHFRHDGGISRAKNVLAIFPEKKIGISIITNESSIRINQKLNDLMHNIYNELK